MRFKPGTAEPVWPIQRKPSGDIDYRKRCVVTVEVGERGFNRIIYGLTAAEYNGGSIVSVARDVTTTFREKR